ncbi:thiol peroxidase (atypical 2-Cys peroxiredoxin) [Winogradskyella eximia]|jgi:thioredoxin-dependent peroxiredoxin|uniref:Thiol peroxidase n=1 Tax=Winogradskyella eximia TaxID=262006 RepID=A0A3D9GS76_9FLAO|nr:thiol peroxidase [Winogradskyella eximia]RED38633.1 thiol peroxidase (atypical 2-Cys peroxiredoxin) [Winogradskyella eximia]
MANITLGGNPIETTGNLPAIGSTAPDFKLTATDLSDKSLSDYNGIRLILNIFPSVDTGTCAQSVRTFNEKASKLNNTKVLCISKDLPFALARFCGAEGLDNVESLSDFKTGNFGKDYGLTFKTGPLETLLSRCIVVIDTDGKIIHTEQVAEIKDEPNYEAALKALK